jgi:hypothetical protein
MKKLATITSLIGVLALAACGGGTEEEGTETEESTETESTETEDSTDTETEDTEESDDDGA